MKHPDQILRYAAAEQFMVGKLHTVIRRFKDVFLVQFTDCFRYGARVYAGGLDVFRLYLFEQFLAVHRNGPGGVNAQTHLVSAHFYHQDFNIVIDYDRLTGLSCQYKHNECILSLYRDLCRCFDGGPCFRHDLSELMPD
jgi:hypothetical protein